MITLILLWALTFWASYAVGFGVFAWIRSLSGLSTRASLIAPFYSLAGLLVSIGFVFIWSLFAGVSGLAAGVWGACALAFTLKHKAGMRQNLRESLLSVTWQVGLLMVFVAFVGIWKSIGPSEVFDEGGYYLPNILLTEQFGHLKGFANLQAHVALNTAWHPILALWGGRYLFGTGLYDLNGFLLLLYVWLLGFNLAKDRGSAVSLSSLVLLLSLPFLLRNLLSAPSGDMVLMLLVFWAVSTVLSLDQQTDSAQEEAWLWLAFLGCAAPIIKLTGAPLALLTLYCFYRGVSARQWGRSSVVVLGCLALVVPWLWRSVFISGYVLFPMVGLDFFDVDWKMPLASTYPFTKGWYYANLPDKPFFPSSESFTNWWTVLLRPRERLMMLGIVVAPLFWVVLGLTKRTFLPKPIFASLRWMAILATMGCLFWWTTVQEPRYGWGFIVLAVVLPLVACLYGLQARWPKAGQVLVFIVMLYQGFMAVKTYREFKPNWASIAFFPTPYPSVEFKTVQAGDFTCTRPVRYKTKVPVGSEQLVYCWEGPLVSTLADTATLRHVFMRGGRLQNGFYKK